MSQIRDFGLLRSDSYSLEREQHRFRKRLKMVGEEWVRRLFDAVDRMDADEMASFLRDDARFRFGNVAPIIGKKLIRDGVADFFSTIKGLNHTVLKIMQFEDDLIVQGEVTYTRKDNCPVTAHFTNLFQMDGPLIRQYYSDIAPSSLDSFLL